jgi:3-oxoadipate enol-lactonase
MTGMRSAKIGPAPRISVDWAGEGALVVLLHGIGGNKRNWRDAMPALADCFQVVAWDARGWGESDDYEGPLSFDDLTDDLLRVLDHFGASQAHIVGLSMGGRIAMHFAERYGSRIASLVLCDTTRGFDDWSHEQRAEFVRSRQEPLKNGQDISEIAVPIARTLLSSKSSDDALAQLVDSLCQLHKESYLKAIEASLMMPAHTRLGEIEVPTLVIVGEDDQLTPPSDARAIVQEIAGAELLVVPDAGHLVNIEAPAEFNAAVRRFLLAQGMTDRR